MLTCTLSFYQNGGALDELLDLDDLPSGWKSVGTVGSAILGTFEDLHLWALRLNEHHKKNNKPTQLPPPKREQVTVAPSNKVTKAKTTKFVTFADTVKDSKSKTDKKSKKVNETTSTVKRRHTLAARTSSTLARSN